MVYTVDNFIYRAKLKHGDRYNYTKVVYKGANTRVAILCNEHGVFWQTPQKHLKGRGCPLCGIRSQVLKRSLTTEEFIRRANEVHKNKYDYSLVHYVNSSTKVDIVCPIHGIFKQLPFNHLKGVGCAFCGNKKRAKSKTSSAYYFINKAKSIHNNKYDYSKVVYQKSKIPVTIICPIHGEFKQKPDNHLQGQGCEKCWVLKSKGESKLTNLLEKYSIIHTSQYKFNDCRHKKPLPFDFAVFNEDGSLKCLIEYQGIQHFKAIEVFGGNQMFQETQFRDKIKYNYCKEHNIPLYYITYKDNIEDKLKEFLEIKDAF